MSGGDGPEADDALTMTRNQKIIRNAFGGFFREISSIEWPGRKIKFHLRGVELIKGSNKRGTVPKVKEQRSMARMLEKKRRRLRQGWKCGGSQVENNKPGIVSQHNNARRIGSERPRRRMTKHEITNEIVRGGSRAEFEEALQ